MKSGDLYYFASAPRSGQHETGPRRVSLDLYVLRSVRKGEAFLTLKNEYTWVKRGVGKSAPWGWANSIPSHYRRGFAVGDNTTSFARSESGAVRAAIARLKRQRAYWVGKCTASVVDIDAEIACLKRWLERHAPVGRNPEGHDPKGHGAQHEHAVAAEGGQAPNNRDDRALATGGGV